MWQKHQFVTVFLVVFLSIQYVVQARGIGHDPYLLSSSVVEKNIQPNALVKKDEYKHSVQKRWAFTAAQVVGKVLFGLSVLATAGNIIFDIILKVEGCEAIFPEIKGYQEDFNRSREQITEYSAMIDTVWAQSQEVLGFIQPTALTTAEISFKLDQIADDLDSIANIFSVANSTAVVQFNLELEREIEAKNQTVLDWTYTELTRQYEALYESVAGRIGMATSVLGHVSRFGGAIWYKVAGKHFQTKSMTKFLDTQAGAQLKIYSRTKPNLVSKFGGPDFNTIIKNTAAAKVEADYQQKKYQQSFSTKRLLGSYMLSGMSIGAEVWMALIKIEQCKNITKEVKSSRDEIEPEAENMVALYETCVENLDNLTIIWEDEIRAPILTEDVMELFREIKGMVENASTTSEDLVTASTAIGNFLDNAEEASGLQEFSDLQEELLAGLHKVHFSLSCYQDKFNVLRNVAERCSVGLGMLEDLMVTVVDEFDIHRNECLSNTGLEYLTIDSIATFISADSVMMGYNEDCILNNEAKQKLVCALHCAKESTADIAVEADITEEYAVKFVNLCQSACSLSQENKGVICSFKELGAALELVLDNFSQYDPIEVTEIYNACPTPAP